MNPNRKKLVPSTLGVLCLLAGWALGPLCAAGAAQEQAAPQYTAEEYKAYQELTAETAASKKIDLIVKFMQDWPKSTLQQHVVAAYQGMMADLQKSQNWTQLVSAGEHFIKLAPDDVYTFSMLATGYQRTNNNKQFVVFGEKAFAKSPDGNLAYYLAKAFKDLGDEGKMQQYGEKAVAAMPENHEMLLELSKSFARMNKMVPAAKYAKQAIKVFQTVKKPDGVDEKAWRDYTSGGLASSYAIVGNVAFEQKDYNSAVANLESSLKYYKKNELAYYYLGQSYWQLNKLDMAMLNLAKAYLFGGSSSKASKGHLDNLYKTTHQQTLVGQERVIAKAKEELK